MPSVAGMDAKDVFSLQTLPSTSRYGYKQAPSDVPDDVDIHETAYDPGKSLNAENGNARSETPRRPPTVQLRRSSSALYLVILYSLISLLSWAAIVYLSFKPMVGRTYGPWKGEKLEESELGAYRAADGRMYYDAVRPVYNIDGNEEWYRAARVLQAIVAVTSLPIATFACSNAAAVVAQRRTKNGQGELSLRKVMTYADRGWFNPFTFLRMLTPSGWRKYGSIFLVVAIVVHDMAAFIAPLQQIFLFSERIRVPTTIQGLPGLVDLPGKFAVDPRDPEMFHYDTTLELITRDFLNSAIDTEAQAQLWPGGEVDCDREHPTCHPRKVTFGIIGILPQPFFAEVPSGFHTGLYRQHVPRINSTTKTYREPFPEDCGSIPGAFFAEFRSKANGSDEELSPLETWSLRACMPTDLTKSPWKATRDRQDFSEELYLDISFGIHTKGGALYDYIPGTSRYQLKLVLSTTAGYFELPNYMNNGTAGPLLDKCDGVCRAELHGPLNKDPDQTYFDINTIAPLQLIARALFGRDSFLETWPRLFTDLQGPEEDPKKITCYATSPLGGLLERTFANTNITDLFIGYPCSVSNEVSSINVAIVQWLWTLVNVGDGILSEAFDAAAFLAIRAWMQFGGTWSYDYQLNVWYDMGQETVIPAISVQGIVLNSALLAAYLGSLLWLAIYAYRAPRWTRTLDAFAMMRIGSAVAEHVPLLAGRDVNKLDVLDVIPGRIGDGAGDDEDGAGDGDGDAEIGRLTLGGRAPLGFDRPYRCYEGMEELMSEVEGKEMKLKARALRALGRPFGRW